MAGALTTAIHVLLGALGDVTKTYDALQLYVYALSRLGAGLLLLWQLRPLMPDLWLDLAAALLAAGLLGLLWLPRTALLPSLVLGELTHLGVGIVLVVTRLLPG